MSIFGDDGVEDLLNGNVNDQQDLPSDDDDAQNLNGGKLFGDDEDGDAEAGTGEQEPVKVEPKKRKSIQRHRLTVETLRGTRGIQTIEQYCKDIKFKGKGHERHDLDEVMRRMQHWAHRMYPTYKFDDVLNNIERLGKKKALQVHMSRYRQGMLEEPKAVDMREMDEEIIDGEATDDVPFDEFDALLGEQIAISKLAPRTPAHVNENSATSTSTTFATPSFSRGNAIMSTPYTAGVDNFNNYNDLAQPLPPSQPESPAPAVKQLTAEQRARIAENRRIALERRRERQLQQQQQINTTDVEV